MSSKTNMEIGWNGAQKDVPMEVVGRSIGSDWTYKVIEGSGRIIDQVDVDSYDEVYRGIWIKSCLKLMSAVYEFDDFCSYRGVHMVRV